MTSASVQESPVHGLGYEWPDLDVDGEGWDVCVVTPHNMHRLLVFDTLRCFINV